LARDSIVIVGYTTQVGDVVAERIDRAAVTVEDVDRTPVRCPDVEAAGAMEAVITDARKASDSVGGAAEFIARGCPPGLGEPVFDKLKADLAKAMLSLPAVTGFEYGSGFAAARLRGSTHNDAFVRRGDGSTGTASNRHGGMLGGISSGEMLVVRVAVKPTSSIPQEQQTVDISGSPTTVRVTGRHDPCLVPRLIPIGEAMIALVLIDHLMRWRAQCGERPGPGARPPKRARR
jgi:chorismate synthase